MSLFCLSEERSVSKDLFGFLRLNSMAELKMKHISFVPFKLGDLQTGLLKKVIHSMTPSEAVVKNFDTFHFFIDATSFLYAPHERPSVMSIVLCQQKKWGSCSLFKILVSKD